MSFEESPPPDLSVIPLVVAEARASGYEELWRSRIGDVLLPIASEVDMPDPSPPPTPGMLEERELQVVSLLAHGLKLTTAAKQALVSLSTLKNDIRSVREKLGVQTLAHVMRRFVEYDLFVDVDPGEVGELATPSALTLPRFVTLSLGSRGFTRPQMAQLFSRSPRGIKDRQVNALHAVGGARRLHQAVYHALTVPDMHGNLLLRHDAELVDQHRQHRDAQISAVGPAAASLLLPRG